MNRVILAVAKSVAGAVALAMMLALTVLAEAALAQDGETEADASIRFIHASPDAPAVDILVDGAPLAQQLEFGQATEYAAVSPGDHNVQVVPAGEGTNATLVDHSFRVDSDQAYTVAVANLLNEIEIMTFQSNLDDLPDGESRVRIINLSPDAGGLAVFQVGGDEWYSTTGFGDASDHRNVEGGVYDLDIRPNGSDQSALAIPGLAIAPGNEYGLYIIGQQSDASLAVLPMVISVSATCSVSLGIGDIADDACVRVVHASIDSPAFDVYIEDALVVEALESGTSTEFILVPAGDGRSVKLVPAGGSLDGEIVDSSVDFESGRARDIIIGGFVDDVKLISDPVDLSPIPVDQSRVRLIHVSADAGEVDVLVTDGDTLFGGVGFESFTDSIIVDAGTYDIQVRRAGEDEVLYRATELEFESGLVYGLIAVGSVDNGTFTVHVVSGPSEPRSGGTTGLIESATPGVETEESESPAETTPTPLSEADEVEQEGTPGT